MRIKASDDGGQGELSQVIMVSYSGERVWGHEQTESEQKGHNETYLISSVNVVR